MRKVLILSVLALCAAPAAAADSAKCDAKPFTLNKPADEAKKPVEPSKVAHPSSATAKAEPKTQPKAKPPLLAPCKSGKSKKG